MTATSATANLTYDGTLELLSGTIGRDRAFLMTAYSGGSRGHKKVSPALAAKYLHNDAGSSWSRLATTAEKKVHGKYIQRGGPLPPGHYVCHYHAHHRVFGECIQLLRTSDAVAIFCHFGHGRFLMDGATTSSFTVRDQRAAMDALPPRTRPRGAG